MSVGFGVGCRLLLDCDFLPSWHCESTPLERSLLMLVPVWPLLGAAALLLAGTWGSPSRGRSVALLSGLLSLGCLLGGWFLPGTPATGTGVTLWEQMWIPGRAEGDLLRVHLAADRIGLLLLTGVTLAACLQIGLVAIHGAGTPAHSGDGEPSGETQPSAERLVQGFQLVSLTLVQLTILAADFGTLALSVALGAVVMLIAAGWSLPESSPALGWLRITWACGSMLILLGL